MQAACGAGIIGCSAARCPAVYFDGVGLPAFMPCWPGSVNFWCEIFRLCAGLCFLQTVVKDSFLSFVKFGGQEEKAGGEGREKLSGSSSSIRTTITNGGGPAAACVSTNLCSLLCVCALLLSEWQLFSRSVTPHCRQSPLPLAQMLGRSPI